MQITDFIDRECIKVPMVAKNREEAIDELTMLLALKHGIDSPEKIADEIKGREATFPYCPQPGIAVPHILNKLVPRKFIAVGKCSPLIDWKTEENPYVHFVFLVVGPEGDSLIELLATISEIFNNVTARELLFHCDTKNSVYNFLHKVGIDLGAPLGFRLKYITEKIPGKVLNMEWSPDGTKIASVGAGPHYDVYIWENGRIVYTLSGHKAEVRGIAWSPDGSLLASGSDDMTIRIYSASTFRPNSTFYCQTKIHGIAWSKDSKTIAVAGHTQGVRRFSDRGVQKPGHLRVMGQFEPAYCVSWSPDGKMLAAGGGREEPSVLVWEASTEKLSARLNFDTDMILSIAWSPNSKLMAVGLGNRLIEIWDTTKWEKVNVLVGHLGVVTAVHFSFNGEFLASKSEDGTVRLWNCETWKEEAQIPDPNTGGHLFAPIAFHPKTLQLATLGRVGHAIRVWELTPSEILPARLRPSGRPQPPRIPYALIEAVSDHKCVLFAGAGFSVGSVSITGNSLKDEIGRAIKKDFSNYDYSIRNFEEVADDYASVNDLQGLLNRLANSIPLNIPTSEAHIYAVNMFPHIITTNWDVLFEKAYRQCGQKRQVLVENIDSDNFHPDEYSLIKMHGTAERKNSLVATLQQFDTYHLTHQKLLEKIADLLYANTVIFIGYNLREAHIRRVLASISHKRGLFIRKSYAVGFFDEVSTIGLKKREIEVIDCETELFIRNLAESVEDRRIGPR